LEELARKFHISSTLIYDCLKDIDTQALVQSKITSLESLSSIILGIDEFSFRGRNYMTSITELRTKKVVGILTTNSKEELEKWLELLPIAVLQKIAGIASDMNASYKKTIQDFIRRKLKDQQHTLPEVLTKEL
jgi:transposase